MTASLDESMIDAYTIAIEQDVTDEDRVPHDLSADIIANLNGLSTEARQEAVIRIAGDLAFAFNGVVMAGKEEVAAKKAEAARLEQERIDRELAEARERQARRREEIARVREQDAQRMRDERLARFNGQEPACGFPNCTIPECYDGTFAEAMRQTSALDDMTRAFDTLRQQAQATTYAWDGWRNLGYTDEAITFQPSDEPLPEWERELLNPTNPGRVFIAPLDTPQPEGDPVLGTGL